MTIIHDIKMIGKFIMWGLSFSCLLIACSKTNMEKSNQEPTHYQAGFVQRSVSYNLPRHAPLTYNFECHEKGYYLLLIGQLESLNHRRRNVVEKNTTFLLRKSNFDNCEKFLNFEKNKPSISVVSDAEYLDRVLTFAELLETGKLNSQSLFKVKPNELSSKIKEQKIINNLVKSATATNKNTCFILSCPLNKSAFAGECQVCFELNGANNTVKVLVAPGGEPSIL